MEQSQREPRGLDGADVLIVEDEYYLADDLARTLGEAGATVIGPASSLAEAERMIAERHCDYAVLDMNLRGQMASSIADRLIAAHVPFVIATGYSGAALPAHLAGRPRIEKPFRPQQIVDALRALERPQA